MQKHDSERMPREKKAPVCVLISDIHYSINTLPLAQAAMAHALRHAQALSVPLVVAGDLLDQKAILRAECVDALRSLFTEAPVSTYIIPGNHCMWSEKSEKHSLRFLEDLVNIVDRPTVVPSLRGAYLIPYQSNPILLKSFLPGIPKGSTIIIHQGVRGAYMGEYVQDKTSIEKEAFANFRTISGHYHRAQDIKCGRPRKGAVGLFSYIGSPYTMTFGEANDGAKGFRVLYDDGLLDLVPTNLRKHIIVERTAEQAFEPIQANPGDLVWVKLRGSSQELDRITKKELGERTLGHQNFKFDKIAESAKVTIKSPDYSNAPALLDRLIEDACSYETDRSILKALWRDLMTQEATK